MRNRFFAFAGTSLFALVLSCGTPTGPTTKPVTLNTATLKKSEGKDCGKIDSVHVNCAEIDLAWPEVKDGGGALKTSVAAWANNFVTGLLAPQVEQSATPITPDDAAQLFFQEHRQWEKDAGFSLAGNWIAQSTDTVLLSDWKYLTLKIDAYTYSGGAHGMPLSAVSTFDVATGKRLTWADLTTDTLRLLALAEQKFRSERADLFKPEQEGGMGFTFDEMNPFKLPDNYGLTDKGIYCCYLHYEVTPYAFGSTEFVLSWAELGALSRMKK